MQGICCPWGCEQHQQCWQVLSFWHHCLGKPSRDSRSATTSHLKAVTQNTLTGQILVDRNLWLTLELWVLSQRCLGLTFHVSTACFKTQAHLHHFLCFNSAVFPISFNCFLCITAQHLPLQQQHNPHPELSKYFCCFYGEDTNTTHQHQGSRKSAWLPIWLQLTNTHNTLLTQQLHRISSEPLYSSTSAISFKFSCLPAITHLKDRNCPSWLWQLAWEKLRGPFSLHD